MMKQYLKLLMFREGREVLGKGFSNLWLLTIVLIATFSSIAFSEGSMIFLRDKMEDPFTNWVSIENNRKSGDFEGLLNRLREPETAERFGYNSVSMEQFYSYYVRGKNGGTRYLQTRFYENMNTPLIHAILSKENLIGNCKKDSTLLVNNTMGFIITMDIARDLGYSEDDLPTFLSFRIKAEHGDSIGIQLIDDKYALHSFPVIAVVRRLPNNVDMVGSTFYYTQRTMGVSTHPFDLLSHEEYQHQLYFFVPQSITDFESDIAAKYPEVKEVLEDPNLDNMRPWIKGKVEHVYLKNDSLTRSDCQQLAARISEEYNGRITQIYRYETNEETCDLYDFLSLDFHSLTKIREFEKMAKSEYGIQLDMAQVASKENFNAVTVMATILSSAIVAFALVCIIMFLVNMLQGYFQKVKRNIGTFKAFGMNTAELIYVYTIILILIVCSAVILALLITWGIQVALPHFGVEKDGFNYFALWNERTYIAAGVVVVSTVATVFVVMRRMLSKTPGDLIYDR